jgi:DNA-directed RNA polymerase specialized sigma24 family protein
MLRAYSALGEVRHARPEVLVAWLRRILARTLADAVKHYERDKRDVGLERSLDADLDRSASGFAAWLAADQTSPSGRAERTGRTIPSVASLLRRGLEELRERLK